MGMPSNIKVKHYTPNTTFSFALKQAFLFSKQVISSYLRNIGTVAKCSQALCRATVEL